MYDTQENEFSNVFAYYENYTTNASLCVLAIHFSFFLYTDIKGDIMYAKVDMIFRR